MEASFPPDEHRPYEEQKALLSRAEYRIYVWEEAGEICGFAAVWALGAFFFLEHLAVAEAVRNAGIGGKLLRAVCAGANNRVVLEVELPASELCRRRIGLYERCGFCSNEYDYTQPPISKGKAPVPLRIMTYGSAVCEEEFRAIRDVLYSCVYQVKEKLE